LKQIWDIFRREWKIIGKYVAGFKSSWKVNDLRCREVDVQIDASVSGKMAGSRCEVGLRLLKEAIMDFGYE